MTWETAPPWAGDEIPLTPRQVELLECYAKGLDSADAARELGVSTSTVKNHTTAIFDKLGLERRCRVAALIQAWRRGEIVLFSTDVSDGNDQTLEDNDE